MIIVTCYHKVNMDKEEKVVNFFFWGGRYPFAMIIVTCYHKVNKEKKEGKAKVVTFLSFHVCVGGSILTQ